MAKYFHQCAQYVSVSSLLWMAWLPPAWAQSINRFPLSASGNESGLELAGLAETAGLALAADAADSMQAADLLGSAPENFNPGQYVPVVPLPPTGESPAAVRRQNETLTIDFRNDFNNLSESSQIIEPTVTTELANGDRLSFSTGLNTFSDADAAIVNVPLKAAWTGSMGDFTTTLGAGIDLFDRRPAALNLRASTAVPVGNSATLSLHLDQGPYKANATSLQNQITAWRYGPNLFWQITPDTSLFSMLRLGSLNDGNDEQQSFSRLEHRLGDFTLAANLFNWRFNRDVETSSGYFSPPDFLVTNAELAWRGQVFSDLSCRAATNLGTQRLTGEWSFAYGYEAICTAEFNQVAVDFGYVFSNAAASTGGSEYRNHSIRGQVRAQF